MKVEVNIPVIQKKAVINTALDKGLKKGLQVLRYYIRNRTPVRTGRLRQSISFQDRFKSVEMNTIRGEVFTDLYYAKFVEPSDEFMANHIIPRRFAHMFKYGSEDAYEHVIESVRYEVYKAISR